MHKSKLPANGKYFYYAIPYITATSLAVPAAVVIQGIYAKYYNISLTTLATVVLFAKLFDAVCDPIIGYCSDRHFRRTGNRMPFILVGGTLLTICSYFLCVPPTNAGTLYFCICFFGFYFAWTLFEIPHIAWAGEIAKTGDDKTKIYSFRTIAGYFGVALFYAVPLMPFFETRDITPDTLRVSTILSGILMLFFLFLCSRMLNDRPDLEDSKNSVLKSSYNEPYVLSAVIKSILSNKPFLIFIIAHFFSSIATGMWYGLIFIYVDAYLNLGSQFSQMFLFAFLIGIIATPFWYKLTLKFGKKTIWIWAMLLAMFSFAYTGVLTPYDTSLRELVILKVVQTLGFVCIGMIAPAMLSEISDYSNWKYRNDTSAIFFSFLTFISKADKAIGGALGLAIAGWYGFDMRIAEHSTESVLGLTIAIAWLPLAFSVVALVFISIAPINSRRHQIIRKRLDARFIRDSGIS